MSMKSCKECGAEISKSAKVCPKCGKKLKNSLLRVLLGIFIMIIGIGMIASGGDSEQTNSNQEKFTLLSDTKIVDSIGTTYIEGEIKNNTDKTYSYVEVTFNLYDENGAQLGTAIDNINNLEPNATWKYKAIGLATEKVATYKLVEISGW